jgi:CRISPR-associated endonuclease/helicase Cas3
MRLLAKRRQGGHEVTLERHLRDSEACASQIFAISGRWGRAWRRFFRLTEVDAQSLLLHVRLAALFHDLGKANEDFQRAVLGTNIAQTVRHEHLSALVLSLPAVRVWLASGRRRVDLDVVIAAVLSHHLKASEGGEYKWGQLRAASTVRLLLNDGQVEACFSRAAEILEIAAPAPKIASDRFGATSPWTDAFAAGTIAARALRRDKSASRRALVAATKAGLIVADAASSGLVRTGNDIAAWIREVVAAEPIAGEDVWAHVIAPRLTAIGKPGVPAVLHPFQERAAGIGPRGLLLAACGAGKTLAAWRWAEAQAREHDIGRVIFLYPTRGTATEGFRDYVSWAPETTSALVHGTAAYELERMHENPLEGRTGKEGRLSEAEQRLFALALWSRRYFSATVDQFLSFLEHRYMSLCLLPVLADAALVIDEVHSFDKRMFDSLVAFLKHFDVPVLCMTATLPSDRREQLRECGLRVFPDQQQSGELEDLWEKERAPRYLHSGVASLDEAFGKAITAFRDGRRVLWVVNVVARAQKLADQLEQALGLRVLCYHSRYRLQDRRSAHEATVAAFQQRTAPAIAITTQVCEMGLDLDAEVLVTEHAPVTSLVQRFGRANRHLAVPGRLGELVTYPPESSSPYAKDDLAGAVDLLAALGNEPVSQARLAELLQVWAPARRRSTGETSFLESGYYAIPGDFREPDDYSHQAVLDADLPDVLAAVKARRPIDRWLVSVPRRQLMDRPKNADDLPSYLGVASARCYRSNRGFIVPEG